MPHGSISIYLIKVRWFNINYILYSTCISELIAWVYMYFLVFTCTNIMNMYKGSKGVHVLRLFYSRSHTHFVTGGFTSGELHYHVLPVYNMLNSKQ